MATLKRFFTVAFFAMFLVMNLNATACLDATACDNGDEEWWAWVWTTASDGEWVEGTEHNGLLAFDNGAHVNIIFARMNPNGSNVPSWGDVWNQTDDLLVQDGYTYVLSGYNGSRMTGSWERAWMTESGKPIWQQTNSSAHNYIAKRKALVGRHCMINQLVKVVEVGSWINSLDNIVDENIDNYATLPSVASVGVGAKPAVSIRDTKNHYAAGTTAGFTLVAGSGSSLLDLNLATAFSISFYLEGELQQTVPVTAGQNIGGVGLSLITVPGSTDINMDFSATAPCEFDEIALMPTGLVDLSAVTDTKVKYAFVGDYLTTTITETAMRDYAVSHGRLAFSLDQGTKQRQGGNNLMVQGTETGYWAGDDLINDDLTDGVAWGVLAIGSGLICRVGAAPNRSDPDQSQPFKAGSIVGFKYGNGSVLNLPVGSSVVIELYRGEWVEKTSALWGTYYEYQQTRVQRETVNANVLSLSLISGGSQQATITAKEDFSHVLLTFPTGLTINVGGTEANYAFISDPADKDHKCDLKLSADASVCSGLEEYQLTAGGGIAVTWSVEDQPAGANASIDATGLLTGMTQEGDYLIKATAADGCCDYITITNGLYVSAASCDNPIVNEAGQEPAYVISDEIYSNNQLISIGGSQLDDPENILDESLEDYALLNTSFNFALADNTPIVGVRKTNGNISDGTNVHRVGFIVEVQSNGLGLNLVDLFNIRTYSNGEQTSSQVIKENNAIKVKLLGGNKVQKLRFAVDVPADVTFDEFVLWKTGALDIQIRKFKVYFAFDNVLTEDAPTACFDPMGCDGTLISETTEARINGDKLQFAGGVQVGAVMSNLTFLVDDDITSAFSYTNTLSLGDGVVIGIDLGRVYEKSKQIGLVVDNTTLNAGLGAQAGSWLTVKTFLNGVVQDSISDWSLLGVNVLQFGDKSYVFLNPTNDYDAITITIGSIVSLLNIDSKYYGIFTRNDYDGDGTPDCQDDDSCVKEYTLDEEATELSKPQDYPLGNLALHRSFFMGDWNSIVLPVDITWLQLRNAFGNDVELAVPEAFYKFDNGVLRVSVPYYDALPHGADNEIAIEKGEYYIIKPYRDADITEGTYTSDDGNTLNAPVYFIPGVTYLRSVEATAPEGMVPVMTVNYQALSDRNNAPRANIITPTEDTGENTIILHGSYVNLEGTAHDKVAAGDYIYDENNTILKLTEDTEMRGFRFYAENNTDDDIMHERDWTEPTAIVDVYADQPVKQGIYGIDGRLIRKDNNVNGLPAGLYIVGGRKVVITRQ